MLFQLSFSSHKDMSLDATRAQELEETVLNGDTSDVAAAFRTMTSLATE